MNILNASIITLAAGLSSCSMVKTSHHVVIDHNINVNVNNFAIDVNHKYTDKNKTQTFTRDALEGLILENTVDNMEIAEAAEQ